MRNRCKTRAPSGFDRNGIYAGIHTIINNKNRPRFEPQEFSVDLRLDRTLYHADVKLDRDDCTIYMLASGLRHSHMRTRKATVDVKGPGVIFSLKLNIQCALRIINSIHSLESVKHKMAQPVQRVPTSFMDRSSRKRRAGSHTRLHAEHAINTKTMAMSTLTRYVHAISRSLSGIVMGLWGRRFHAHHFLI